MSKKLSDYAIGSFHTIGKTKYITESSNEHTATLRSLKTGKIKVVELDKNVKINVRKTLLALDASTTSTGYSVFENGKLIKSGTIAPSATLSMQKRVCYVVGRLEDIVEEFGVENVVEEDIFFNGMTEVFEALAQLKGALMYMLNSKKIKVEYVPPTAWKSFFGIARRDSLEGKKLAIAKCKELTGKIYQEDCAESVLIGMYKLRK